MVYSLIGVRWPNLTLVVEVAVMAGKTVAARALQEQKKGRNLAIAARSFTSSSGLRRRRPVCTL
jgi:hypothetical protein